VPRHRHGHLTSPGDFGTSPDVGEVDAGATVHVIINAHANPNLGHVAPTPPRVTGRFTVTSSATVMSKTTDPGPHANTNTNAMSVTIDTVSTPPQNPFGIPGTGNAILTWENPA